MNVFQKIYHLYSNVSILAEIQGQDASDLIKLELLSDKPTMIARIGSTELQAIVYHINSKKLIKRPLALIQKQFVLKKMNILSGFYPSTEVNIARFSQLMMEDFKEVNILGSWRKEEKIIANELKQAKKIRLEDIEPYYHQSPWTTALKNKRILVIHPFEESIRHQYEKRAFLFNLPDILPEFELKTIKAVQSIAGNKPDFDDWFAALESMKEQINQADFDIALIGCGAYGFPLAAHVKRNGKKAVLMGGALQILFGIKGKRWESHPYVSKLINEHWIRPLDIEKPENSIKIDGGSYW